MDSMRPMPRHSKSSLYHSAKSMTAQDLYFASGVWDIPVSEINQGPCYGLREGNHFYVDNLFGTVINRLTAMAVLDDFPLLRYGKGTQTRAFISIEDSIRAMMTVMENPHLPNENKYRGINQFSPQDILSSNQIIEMIRRIAREEFGIEKEVKTIPNPRIEPEVHPYGPKMEILPKMGFKPSMTIEDEIRNAMRILLKHKDRLSKLKEDIKPKRVAGWVKEK